LLVESGGLGKIFAALVFPRTRSTFSGGPIRTFSFEGQKEFGAEREGSGEGVEPWTFSFEWQKEFGAEREGSGEGVEPWTFISFRFASKGKKNSARSARREALREGFSTPETRSAAKSFHLQGSPTPPAL
jgi:hypothetical protein